MYFFKFFLIYWSMAMALADGITLTSSRTDTTDVPLNKGIVLLYETDILISTSQWELVFSLNIDHYHKAMNKINQHINTLLDNQEVLDFTNQEFVQLRRALSLVDSNIASLQTLLLIGRPINVHLHKTLEKLESTNQTLVHSVKEQVTYTKNLNEWVKWKLASLNTLVSTLDLFYNNCQKQQEWESDTLLKLQCNVNQTNILSYDMRTIELFMTRIQKELLRIQKAIEMKATGEWVTLVPYSELLSVLSEVATKLPEGTTLVFKPILENMFLINKLVTAHIYVTHGDIMVVVSVPLKGVDRILNLYKALPLPVYHEGLGRHIQVEAEGKYLGVSVSRQYYALIDESTLTQCHSSFPVICDPSFILFRSSYPTCLSSLYFNNEEAAHTLCKRVLMPEGFNSIWTYHTMSRKWIYSLPEANKVTTYCPRGTNKTTEMVLTGTGYFKQPAGCYVYTPHVTLLPNEELYMEVQPDAPQLVVPGLPSILSSEQERMINESRRQNPERFHQLMQQLNKATDLRYVFQIMQQPSNLYMESSWLWALTGTSVVIGAFLVVTHPWTKRLAQTRTLKTIIRSSPTSVQEIQRKM